jgi:hypothetical protein
MSIILQAYVQTLIKKEARSEEHNRKEHNALTTTHMRAHPRDLHMQ